MDTLQSFITKNPELSFFSVADPAFRRYDRVLDFDAGSLLSVCEATSAMPPDGSRYVPAIPELEALPAFQRAQQAFLGETNGQIGCCWGYNTLLNCLEYHRSSEFNIAVSDLLLLLASQQNMETLICQKEISSAFSYPREPPLRCMPPHCISVPVKQTTADFAVL